MTSIDPRLAAALATQLLQWRATLGQGAARIGWKLGVGHLTSATCLDPGAAYHAGDAGDLRADADVAASIAGIGVALEIVDLARPPDDPMSVVAANVFHRAVAFGPFQPARPAGGIRGRLLVNGRTRASASAPAADELAGRVEVAARLLGAMGERLEAGDRIITGSVVQVAVTAGDQVVADLGPLGRVDLSIQP